MNVWLFHHYAIPPNGAGITRHFSLAKELVKKGHKVTIIAANISHRHPLGTALPENSAFKKEVFEGVDFLWVKAATGKKGYFWRVLNMLTFSWRILVRTGLRTLKEPEIIIGSSPDLFSALAAHILARRMQKPSVLLVGDLWPLALIEIGGVSRFHPFVLLLGAIERYLYKHSDAIISPQKKAYRYIARHGARPEKIFWVPNGVDTATLPSPAPSLPSEGRAFEVIYAGSLGPSNGTDALIETASILKGENIVFRFVGAGAYVDQLKKKTTNLNHVIFEPAVPKQEIYTKLSTADVFIVNVPNHAPYRYGLALNKLFDYMAAARPVVIAAPVAHNPIIEGDAGIAVAANDARAMADALITLKNMTAESRFKMGLNGRRAIERSYNFSHIGDIFETVLIKTLHSSDAL